MHRTLLNQLWHSQTMAHNPAESTHMVIKGDVWFKSLDKKEKKQIVRKWSNNNTDLLLSVNDLGLQICRDDSPSERKKSIILLSLYNMSHRFTRILDKFPFIVSFCLCLPCSVTVFSVCIHAPIPPTHPLQHTFLWYSWSHSRRKQDFFLWVLPLHQSLVREFSYIR